jgi:hypothetical protein
MCPASIDIQTMEASSSHTCHSEIAPPFPGVENFSTDAQSFNLASRQQEFMSAQSFTSAN